MFSTIFQEVEEFNHGRWYKKMYNTIHKAKDDDGKKISPTKLLLE